MITVYKKPYFGKWYLPATVGFGILTVLMLYAGAWIFASVFLVVTLVVPSIHYKTELDPANKKITDSLYFFKRRKHLKEYEYDELTHFRIYAVPMNQYLVDEDGGFTNEKSVTEYHIYLETTYGKLLLDRSMKKTYLRSQVRSAAHKLGLEIL